MKPATRSLWHHQRGHSTYQFIVFSFLFFALAGVQNVQGKTFGSENNIKGTGSDIYGISKTFIENIGQYGDTVTGYAAMGKILFAYEGFGEPVLFTEKGIIHLQKKIQQIPEEEREEMERKGMSGEEISGKTKITEQVITSAWLNTNPDVKIIAEELADGYHTYGSLPKKALAYRKITYRQLYPGIDLVYTFNPEKSIGFEYSLIAGPNSDLSLVKLIFGGDIKSIKKDGNGNLVVKTDIGEISESIPLSYYGDKLSTCINSPDEIKSKYNLDGSELSFAFPDGRDANKKIVIDPFVTATGSLIGGNAGKAKDVDFDYAGNVYVTGGGDGNVHKLAKFDPNGVLLWTFTGTLAVPAWSFGPYYGGWVVEKSTGNIYMGQGFDFATGYIVIRLNTAGIYDNYVSTGNGSANENWKMFWSCNNGSPQILIAGGGTTGNLNLGVLTPPSPVINGINLTGLSGGCCQDVVDMAIDPANLDVYPIYASLGGMPFVNNRMYKNTIPYNASFSWTNLSGFNVLSEANNRPYLVTVGAAFSDNSANILAINSAYLFYWDGKNLQAYSKATGFPVGAPLTIAANTAMMQGGIEADECNNVFIGSTNGTIKVYQFNGTSFNDAPADIIVPGFTTKSVYDLVINDGLKLLYACGDGFVAAFDLSSYACGSAVYTANVSTDCVAHTATASLSPAPPQNSTVTYTLFNGQIQVASNTTGNFSGLTPNVTYSIHAIVNQACSGTESIVSFTIVGPSISVSQTNTTCGNNSGTITVTATGGTNPLSYSINNGVSFQASGNFTNVAAGFYQIVVNDATGCGSTSNVVITNTNGPAVTLTKTDAFCGAANGSITATGSGGTAPYQYALNSGTFQSSNIFSGVAPGLHVVTIRDASGCINNTTILLSSIGNTQISTVTIGSSCGNNNGSITANATGGTGPYLYSINGTTFQTTSVFTGLAPGGYTITARDANNCVNFIAANVANIAGPQLSATAVPTSCNSLTGTITITATGIPPFRYSINGGTTFQVSNTFNFLSGGSYVVTVKDANGCLNTTNAVVNLSIPQVTDSTTISSCAANDGTITAIGTGGILPYQYSINGTTFQSSNSFTGLGAGNYTLTIIDAAGCTNTITPVTISNASGLAISAVTTNTSCVSSTGSVTATGTGGQAPLQYSINGTTFQSSNLFTGLAAGNYTLSTRDANNCIATAPVTINRISAPSVSATTTSTSCNSITGTITATGTSGTLPYQYSINGTTFFSSNFFSALAPGPYTVTIRDANLCTGTASVLISNAGGGTGPSVSGTVLSASCGQANGRINASSSGGQNPRQYSIDGVNWQGSGTINNVPPGTYTLYVRDANGCINFTTITVPNFPGPQVSAVVSLAGCGTANGSITATGFGGTAPYRYSIDGGVTFQTGTTFIGLISGFYTLVVRDAANVCRNSIVVFVGNSNGPSVAFLKTDASCAINNGTITANGAGGVAPLTYSINGVNFQSSNFFTGLSTGQYLLTIKDATGCANSSTVTIGSQPLPQISVSPSSATCGNSNATITVNGSSGVAPYQYAINGNSFQASNIFNALAPGGYTIKLMDANNCIASTNATLSNVSGPQLTNNTISTTCNNNNGTLILTGVNGTLPYQYSINGTTFQTSFMFTGLASGSNTATIKDANNCLSTSTYNIGAIPGPVLTAYDSASGCGGNIVALRTGGAPPFQYNINNLNNQSGNIFPCLSSGNYMVIITDANGCQDSVPLLLSSSLPIELLSFTGYAEKNFNMLEWTTASEINNASFNIENSRTGQDFQFLGAIDGGRNSNINLNYSFKDEHPYPGINYYRLKQIDFDGRYSYSNIIALNSGAQHAFEVWNNYQSSEVVITCQQCNEGEEKIELHDAAGRLIYHSAFTGNNFSLSTSGYSKGPYSLQLLSDTNNSVYKIVIY